MTAPTSAALAAIVLGVAALVLSALSIPSAQQPATPAPPPAAAPAVVDLSVIITGVGAVGESKHHFFNPSMIVVRRGDTVRLRVMNLTFARHGFQIDDYGVRTTGGLPGGPRGQETLSFEANRGGIFKFHCNIPYNPTTGDCSPDHETQVGYLVVLDQPR